MTRIYMLSPNFNTSYFDYAILTGNGNSNTYDTPNILLPLISEGTQENINFSQLTVGAELRAILTNSAFHVEKFSGSNLSDGDSIHTIQLTHTSKVLSALCKPYVSDHNTLNETPLDINWPSRDIYDNCNAIFKDMKSTMDGSNTLLDITSSPLKLGNSTGNVFPSLSDGSTGINNYLRLLNGQPTSNLIINLGDNNGNSSKNMVFVGTKTEHYPFDNRENYTIGSRETAHYNVNNSDNGEMYSAQMFLKPQFNITTKTTLASNYVDGATSLVLTDATDFPNSGSGSINNIPFSWTNKSGNTLTVADLDANYTAGVDVDYSITSVQFTMNTSSTHHWLNFVPNLTGYYIVGSKTIDGNFLPTSESGSIVTKGTPNYIGKILSHTVSGSPDVHTLTFDKAILNSTDGTFFRLMRLSDTVFEETPDYFEVNVMQDSGLEYKTVPKNLRTGDVSSKNQFGEGIYSMYMLLNIDEDTDGTTVSYLERRDLGTISTAISGTNASNLFTDGDEINCYITDGINSQSKSLTVTFDNSGTDKALKFEYDGVLNGDGCVSFGETIDVTIPKKLSIKPTKCYLGTTFSIGGIIENEIENIAKEAELDLNYEQSLRDYTTNLVDRNTDGSAKITGNVITCVEKPIDVIVGDVLYTQEGYLVGKVNSISNTTITIDGIIFVPSAYDELIRRQRKTHVSNVRFEDTDSFSAINFLANKRGLDYKISNGEIIARNIEDVHGLRKYSINYKSGHNLISVESNKSLFDKANKVIVIGDGVKAEAEMPTKGRTRTIRHVDSSIKSLSDAKIKAHQLLQIHNADVRKIKLKIQKEGLELLEAGDILTLDFPNHDIPINDYQVFEIENVLSGVATITVGTFNKTIAERLGELSSNQTRSSFTLFGKNSVQSVVGKSIFDSFSIKNNTIEYKISTTNSNLGFNNTLGFTTLLGFGSGSTTLKTYKSEKDV